MLSSNRRLRPMGITDILDETVEIYKSSFLLLVGISAFLHVPYTLIMAPFQRPGLSFEDYNLWQFIGLAIAMVLLLLIVNPVVTGALTFGISEKYLERETSIGQCYRRILKPKVFLPFLGANILIGLLTLLAALPSIIAFVAGFLLITNFASFEAAGAGLLYSLPLFLFGFAGLILPTWVALRFTLVAPAFFVESRSAVESVKRSWGLMKSNVLKALGLTLIVSIAISMIQGIISAPLQLISVSSAMKGAVPSHAVIIVSTIIQMAVSTLLMPISSVAIILLYYDIRIRKEGFDLELLANQLDQNAKASTEPEA
ncbi:MAG: hypothetical protein ABFD54_08920 [Armatimonadota bacterium]|nr:glycerophosphoryl diester phosphodiesterase membrane domain-containing protein [bacterium]